MVILGGWVFPEALHRAAVEQEENNLKGFEGFDPKATESGLNVLQSHQNLVFL